MSAQPSFALDNYTKPPCPKVRRRPRMVRSESEPRYCNRCGTLLVRRNGETRSKFADRQSCGRFCRMSIERERWTLREALATAPLPGNGAWRVNVTEARRIWRQFHERRDPWALRLAGWDINPAVPPRLSRAVWDEAERLEGPRAD
jgi:hypothetical protein